jgi:hypothetical protein
MKKAHPTLCLLFLSIPLCLLFGFLYYLYSLFPLFLPISLSLTLERDFVWAFLVKTNALFRTFSILFLTLSVFLSSSNNSEYTFPFRAMHRPLREGVLLDARRQTKMVFEKAKKKEEEKKLQNHHRDRKSLRGRLRAKPSVCKLSNKYCRSKKKKKYFDGSSFRCCCQPHTQGLVRAILSVLSSRHILFLLFSKKEKVISDRENTPARGLNSPAKVHDCIQK